MIMICIIVADLVFTKVLHKIVNKSIIFAYLLTLSEKGCIIADERSEQIRPKIKKEVKCYA